MKTLQVCGFLPCSRALCSYSEPGSEVFSIGSSTEQAPLVIPRRGQKYFTDEEILARKADAVVLNFFESTCSLPGGGTMPPALLFSKLRQAGSKIFLYTTGRDQLSDPAFRNAEGLTDKTISAYVDHIFIGSPDNLSLSSCARSWSWLPPAIRTEVTAIDRPPGPIRILHIPWRLAVEEASSISSALADFASRHRGAEVKIVDPKDTGNWSDLYQLIASADIFVEQYTDRCYGLLGLVALSAGCTLLSGTKSSDEHTWPPLALSPALNFAPSDLAVILESLTAQPKSLRDISRRSTEYAMRYHNPEQIWRMMQLVLERYVSPGGI